MLVTCYDDMHAWQGPVEKTAVHLGFVNFFYSCYAC